MCISCAVVLECNQGCTALELLDLWPGSRATEATARVCPAGREALRSYPINAACSAVPVYICRVSACSCIFVVSCLSAVCLAFRAVAAACFCVYTVRFRGAVRDEGGGGGPGARKKWYVCLSRAAALLRYPLVAAARSEAWSLGLLVESWNPHRALALVPIAFHTSLQHI